MSQVPATLAAHQIRILQSHLGGVRDGIPEDVHQARVATRRLRELLPLLAGDARRSLEHVHELVRDTGRALGVVRELDILMALSDQLTTAHPTSAAVLAATRVELRDERERAARRLIKRLDRLDFAALTEDLAARRFANWRGASGWRHAIHERIEARSTRLERAVEHASGVYFPNRLHRVRIHLKKLRYLVEIAEQTNLWHPGPFRRDAARLQDVLGDLHDRQVLLDRLARTESHSELRSAVREDILSRHTDYLGQRDRLRGMIATSHRFAQGHRHLGKTIVSSAAVALVLPVGVTLLGRQGAFIGWRSGPPAERHAPPRRQSVVR